MDMLNYLLEQVEVILQRKLTDAEKEFAKQRLKDHADSIEQYISTAVKSVVRKIVDTRN